MNDSEMMFSKKYLLGSFAGWAVRQSPYYVPDNLEIVLRQLSDCLPTYLFDNFGFMVMEKKNFHKWFISIITQVPEVVDWNRSKDGNNKEFLFVSLFNKPTPDSDFIDLDALVMNVKRELIKENE